jgi:hypothetical protein
MNIPEDVIKVCKNMKRKTSKDLYGFVQKQILDDANILAPVIAHLMNRSQETGICPASSKVAIVVPVYKKDDESLYGNYRPNSLLPSSMGSVLVIRSRTIDRRVMSSPPACNC